MSARLHAHASAFVPPAGFRIRTFSDVFPHCHPGFANPEPLVLFDRLGETLMPPARAARGREGERLFILLDLAGPASPHLYRELREVVAQTYWVTVGSITAALRQAAAAANRHLFQSNLHSTPSDRCDGSLICAVSHGDDLFILQAGSGQAYFLHREHLELYRAFDQAIYARQDIFASIKKKRDLVIERKLEGKDVDMAAFYRINSTVEAVLHRHLFIESM